MPPEAFGAAMRAATEAAGGENPLLPAGAGEIAEQAFLADARARAGRAPRPRGHAARLRRALPRRARPQRRAVRLLPRAARARRAARHAHQQRARVGAALARRSCPIDEIFETVVDSGFVGVRKPDPRIYALVLERLEPARRGVRVRRRPRRQRRGRARARLPRRPLPRDRAGRRGARRAARLTARAARHEGACRRPGGLSCRSPAGPSSRAPGTPRRARSSARARARAARSRAPAPRRPRR